MVGSKNRNYHRNHGCNLVEIAFHERSCNTEVAFPSRMTPIANARHDLFEAMTQIAETGHGPKEQLSSMGCSIKWKH